MPGKILIRGNNIAFRDTAEDDLDRIIEMERNRENAPYIRQWHVEQHRSALADDNIAHLTVLSADDDCIVGYVILIGLKNPDESIEFKRIVINNKGRGFSPGRKKGSS